MCISIYVETRSSQGNEVLDGKWIRNPLGQITVKSYSDAASTENTSEFRFARVQFYQKKKKKNPAIYEFFNEAVSQYLYSECSEPHEPIHKKWIAYCLLREPTINFEKFISVAGSFYL